MATNFAHKKINYFYTIEFLLNFPILSLCLKFKGTFLPEAQLNWSYLMFNLMEQTRTGIDMH